MLREADTNNEEASVVGDGRLARGKPSSDSPSLCPGTSWERPARKRLCNVARSDLGLSSLDHLDEHDLAF